MKYARAGRSPGFPFVLGWYHAANESFTSGPVWNADAGSQFTWASMQLTGQQRLQQPTPRMMIVAWISASGISPPALSPPAGAAADAHPVWQAGPQAPNSVLSLMREIKYDVAIKNLVSNPVAELALLRNGSLFSMASPT